MFLVIKMYLREGQDSNITNYTHTEAGIGKGSQLSHPTLIFHEPCISMRPHLPWFSTLLVHQPPSGFISFPTELGPHVHHFNPHVVSAFKFPDPLPSATCPLPTSKSGPRLPPSNPSSLCLSPLESRPAVGSHHPIDGCYEELGFLTSAEFFIQFLTLSSVDFSQLILGSPKPASTRGQIWTFFCFSSLLEMAFPMSCMALPPRQIGDRTTGQRV